MDTATGNDLVAALERLGVEVTTVGDTEVGGRCPVHHLVTGKEDRSPSWSMNTHTGLWLCYACGARGNFSQLLMQLTGSSDDAVAVNTFLIESGLERLKTQLITDTQPVPPSVDLSTFRRFIPVPEQLLTYRRLDADVAYRHGIRWDPQPRHWIIPIVAPNGDLWGWQAKGKGYFRNVPNGVTKSRTLFGLDRFKAETAVLVESPLDVVRLASLRPDLEVQGLSSFGAHVSTEQLHLLTQHADRLVVALDNDEAGINAARKVLNAATPPRGGINFIHYRHTSAKDIGDMTNDELDEALAEASAIPWWLNRPWWL